VPIREAARAAVGGRVRAPDFLFGRVNACEPHVLAALGAQHARDGRVLLRFFTRIGHCRALADGRRISKPGFGVFVPVALINALALELRV
jgi:hypothetical protein